MFNVRDENLRERIQLILAVVIVVSLLGGMYCAYAQTAEVEPVPFLIFCDACITKVLNLIR